MNIRPGAGWGKTLDPADAPALLQPPQPSNDAVLIKALAAKGVEITQNDLDAARIALGDGA